MNKDTLLLLFAIFVAAWTFRAIWKEDVATNLLPYAREGLRLYMLEQSEERWCSGWYMNLENILWSTDDKFRQWVAAVGGYWVYNQHRVYGEHSEEDMYIWVTGWPRGIEL